MKSCNKKIRDNKRSASLVFRFLFVVLIFMFPQNSALAAETKSAGPSYIWIYVLFAVVVAIAVIEGVYIAYLKIIKSDKGRKRDNYEEKD